ncbi:hypothetical protein P692DRAFT_20759993, partial [Suillus brevipes Sb2]
RTTISKPPDSLTSSLLVFATLPLPDSYLFRQSCAGSDLIDESDLTQWDQPPPYNYPAPPDSPEEARFTENLVDVMHGRYLRIRRESRTNRAAMYMAGETSRILMEIREAEKGLVAGWDGLRVRVANLQGCSRHKLVAECYLQGVARAILDYRREEDWLATGKNPYI